jgi:hypothetical protein
MTKSKTPHTSTDADAAAKSGEDKPVEIHNAGRPPGRHAAHRATHQGSLWITLPGLGRINLGTPEQLAYFAGITALAACELIEWPIAVVIAAGHALAEQHRNKTLHAFGEALEEA